MGAGWNVLVQTIPQPGLELTEEEGQVSFIYTQKESRPAFRYRLAKNTKESGTRFVTVVAPYNTTPPVVSVRLLGQPPIGSSRVQLEVVVNGVAKRIDYHLPD